MMPFNEGKHNMKWKKVETGYWTLTGSNYSVHKVDLMYLGDGWWVYKDGIRLVGYANFQEAKGYANFHAKADADENKAYAEAQRTREYMWTVEASGYVEATSFEEAKEILSEEADGLVADDRKYWILKVEEEAV